MFNIKLPMQTRHELNRKANAQKEFLDADLKTKAAKLIEAARLVNTAFGLSKKLDEQTYGGTYDETYAARVIPVLAKRIDPSIDLLPGEVPVGNVYDPALDMSDEDLAIYISNCMSWNTYDYKLVHLLDATQDPFIPADPEYARLIDAVHFLTTDVCNGNFAAHAMLAYNAEAAQRGVKQLPGKFNGWETRVNENWLKIEGREMPNFIFSMGTPGMRTCIGVFETEEQIDAAAARIIEIIASGMERPEDDEEIKAIAEEIGVEPRSLERVTGWNKSYHFDEEKYFLIKESAEKLGYEAILLKDIRSPEKSTDNSMSM